jgi:NAD(P)-dependent dehydrogenase (short-subunit alcohol dehydrogenase family)/rhamnose utilization protein RhaD (predicted bifunctional aldolase and dehydrogenase)
MDRALGQLFEISRRYGGDADYVLAGGGNTSVKIGGVLHVKASGTSLADASEATFVAMDRGRLAAMWARSYSPDQDQREKEVLADLLAACVPGSTLRPSVETLLHDLFPEPLVVHTHPAAVNGLTCGAAGKRAAAELFGDDVLWVEAIEPGYVLAARMRQLLQEHRENKGKGPALVLIENHGLFVPADGPDGVRKVTDRVVAAVRGRLQRQPDEAPAVFDRERAALLAPALRMQLKGDLASSIVVFRSSGEALRRLASAEAFAVLDEPFTPDHMVYCGRTPLFVAAQPDAAAQAAACATAIASYRERWGVAPRVIGVQGLGVYCWGPTKVEADTTWALFRDALRIACYGESFGGARPMPPALVKFIAGWEVERFRKRQAEAGGGAAPRAGARLAERVAIVTGGGQGFGAGLARLLAAEGAHVVVADVNEAEAAARAAELAGAHGAGRAFAVKADVGSWDSAWAMAVAAVLEYGGVDLMLSNAGILRAGDLEATEPQTFELVTRVNYTGYYNCARAAARIMRVQHGAEPAWWTDIIQINSKSGLTGSRKNFAYAGGKFGGIGLTQSFALELIEHGIKVNAVCPGNFFDGPLWSDPRKGLFVQYLAAGKVPGARTVDDVRRYYESLVPMGRGVAVDDVFRAVLYAIEQRYETGQAIPVTGGQLMLA